jgi:hypothetical protein
MQLLCGKQQTRRTDALALSARLFHCYATTANLIVRVVPVKEFANLGKENQSAKE